MYWFILPSRQLAPQKTVFIKTACHQKDAWLAIKVSLKWQHNCTWSMAYLSLVSWAWLLALLNALSSILSIMSNVFLHSVGRTGGMTWITSFPSSTAEGKQPHHLELITLTTYFFLLIHLRINKSNNIPERMLSRK